MAKGSKLKRSRVRVPPHRTEYVLPNEQAQDDTPAAGQQSNVRWLLAQFHREAKQLTGLQAGECRLARSQRKHIALALRTWARLKQLAYQAHTSVHQLKQRLLDAYIRHELAQPTLCFA